MKMSSPDNFFPDHIKEEPEKPEPVNDDWSVDDYSENCSNCGLIYAYHSPSQALFCAKLVISNSISKGEKN
jgi:hypothetical protein